MILFSKIIANIIANQSQNKIYRFVDRCLMLKNRRSGIMDDEGRSLFDVEK
ncbi:hypothetical protein [Pseudanabaena sp. UWO310]|uniref:hypothetical protein n=1 Tax=Pseudanabaena sp. UWO310 TaxID=2480795 RepID=UPI001681A807|nr:hypothetical protein [Pseudanabaena sp. UWO310]